MRLGKHVFTRRNENASLIQESQGTSLMMATNHKESILLTSTFRSFMRTYLQFRFGSKSFTDDIIWIENIVRVYKIKEKKEI